MNPFAVGSVLERFVGAVAERLLPGAPAAASPVVAGFQLDSIRGFLGADGLWHEIFPVSKKKLTVRF